MPRFRLATPWLLGVLAGVEVVICAIGGLAARCQEKADAAEAWETYYARLADLRNRDATAGDVLSGMVVVQPVKMYARLRDEFRAPKLRYQRATTSSSFPSISPCQRRNEAPAARFPRVSADVAFCASPLYRSTGLLGLTNPRL
jgi:hypothetical protein